MVFDGIHPHAGYIWLDTPQIVQLDAGISDVQEKAVSMDGMHVLTSLSIKVISGLFIALRHVLDVDLWAMSSNQGRRVKLLF